MEEHRALPISGIDWREAHAELCRLARSRAAHDYEEGRWLLAALRSAAHVHLGYASFAEYLERLFGYPPRMAAERMRVAEALEDLPEMSRALREGDLTWSAVRELTRVAAPETEGAWIAAGRGRTVRQVEDLVAGRRRGDRPDDPAWQDARRHVLRLELSAEAMAAFREAVGKLRRDAGGRLDEDEAMLLMARRTLGGPTDEGRANYQIALTVCERCDRGWQQGRGELLEVGAEVVEMGRCDGQTVPGTHVGRPAQRATQTIPPAVRRLVVRRDRGRCVVPGCRSAVFLDVHHLTPRHEGGDHDPDGLVLLCAAHHRALHRGFLIVEGSVSRGLSFRHADGTRYGGAASPHAVEVLGETFQALRSLGFKESEARRAIETVRTHVGMGATTEGVLRQALAVLHAGSRHASVTGSST